MIRFYVRYLFALILFLLIVFYFLYDSGKTGKKDVYIKNNSYIDGLKVISKKDGSDAWILSAGKAILTKDETMAEMNAVTIKLIKDGLLLNAEAGSFNMLTNDLSLTRNIKIHTKGSVISAKDLRWNPSDETLTTDGAIKMEGAKFQIEGKGMTATQDRKVKLTGKVKATFY